MLSLYILQPNNMLPLTSSFTSQLEYGRYGHLICTPVSCALAVSFVINNTPTRQGMVFSRKRVDDVMRSAHRLYGECFATTTTSSSMPNNKQLMLSDIQDRIPSDSVTYEEVAGMTTPPPSSVMMSSNNNNTAAADDDDAVKVDDMVLEPLTTVLSVLQARTRMQYAVVVTMDEHTTCYLLDIGGRMLHFDPLPASLTDVTCTWRRNLESRPPMEYSGLILYNNKA